MSFDLSETESSARAGARAIAATHAAPSVPIRDAEARWDAALFSAMGREGLLGAPLPEAHGGGGRGALTTALLHEGFGHGSEDMGLAIAWGAHTHRVSVPIAALGTEAQRARLLPALARGDIVGAIAHDASGIVARREGDAWVLEGACEGVVNGPIASLFLIAARTPQSPSGRTVFLVDRATPHLHVGAPARMIGMRTALFGALTLSGIRLGDDSVLGAPLAGDAALALGRRWQRACLSAHWLGAMESAFERAVSCAKTRVDLGRPLARSQAARTTLADMRVRCEIARRLAYRAARAIDAADIDADKHAAMAALHIAAGAPLAARGAASIHGPDGASSDHPAARAQRDAAMIEVAWESVDHLRSMLGGALLGIG